MGFVKQLVLQPRFWWLLLIGWSGLIWLLATRQSVPTTGNNQFDYVWRQGGHGLLHTILYLLALRAARCSWSPSQAAAFALIFSSGHAVLDEMIQIYVPGRSANFEDVITNLAGVLFGILIVKIWKPSIKWI